MAVALVGASHRTAAIDVRERFYAAGEARRATLRELLAGAAVEECVVLSTCNRTEYYLHAPDREEAARAVAEVMAHQAGLTPERVEPFLYRHVGRDVAVHLYRVACGLDSLVPGEHQIQGQVREAYREASEGVPGSVGPVLHRLFQTALAVGGRVRAETRIGEGAASIPSAAAELAGKVFGSLHGRVAMVLGAGDMGKLTLSCLVREGVEAVWVVSRSLERAERAAAPVGGRAIPLEAFWDALADVDIVVTSTGAPRTVIPAHRVWAARRSSDRPLVILDIALPRDVETEVAEIPGVFLYNIDDLQRVVESAEGERVAEIGEATALIETHGDEFWRWYRAREIVPLIRRMRAEAESLRRREVEAALDGLDLPEETRERIHRATRQLLARLLHTPTVELRRLASEPDAAEAVEVVRRLLGGEEGGAGER